MADWPSFTEKQPSLDRADRIVCRWEKHKGGHLRTGGGNLPQSAGKGSSGAGDRCRPGSGPCGDGIPPVTHDRDWAGAGVSFKRARELDPSNDNVIRGATSLAMNLSGGGPCALLSSAGASLTPVLHGHGLTIAGVGGGGVRGRWRGSPTQRDQQSKQKSKHGNQSPLG